MTRAFVRFERQGKFENVEIDQLTDEELDQLAVLDPDRGWAWAKFLAAWIRDNVQEQESQE